MVWQIFLGILQFFLAFFCLSIVSVDQPIYLFNSLSPRCVVRILWQSPYLSDLTPQYGICLSVSTSVNPFLLFVHIAKKYISVPTIEILPISSLVHAHYRALFTPYVVCIFYYILHIQPHTNLLDFSINKCECTYIENRQF